MAEVRHDKKCLGPAYTREIEDRINKFPYYGLLSRFAEIVQNAPNFDAVSVYRSGNRSVVDANTHR